MNSIENLLQPRLNFALPSRSAGSCLLLAAAAVFAVSTAQATTYYWDNNGSTAGFGNANGTWAATTTGNSTQGWSISSAGNVTVSDVTTLSTNATTDALNFGTASAGLGAGTITVSGTVNAGAITVGSASGAITLSGGTITLNDANGSITNNSTNLLTIGSSIDYGTTGSSRSLAGGSGGITISGAISGSGTAPRVNTSGAVTIGGNITTESLQINSGTVTVGNSGLVWGAVLASDAHGQGGTLNLNGNNLTVSTITDGISITDNAVGTGTSILTLNGGTSSQNAATTGIISDGATRKVALIYNGVTTLTLSANNTFSGNTKSNGAGKIVLANNLAIQNSAIDTSGNGTFSLGSGITTPTIGGLIGSKNLSTVLGGNATTYNAMTALTLNTVSGQNLSYSGNITDTTSGLALTKSGLGTQALSGINAYTGLTTVSAGELDLNTTGGQSIAGNLTVSGGTAKLMQGSQINTAKNLVVSGGTFDIQGFNQTVANVQLTSGNINGSGGTLTSTNAFEMQAGSVSAKLGGAVGLNKTTGGTLTLSGANTYNGTTTVSAGTLLLSGGNINSTSGVSVANGATFTNNSGAAFNKALTLTEGATLSGSSSFAPTSLTLIADLTGGPGSFTTFAVGTLAKSGSGNLELTLSGITNGTYTLFSGSLSNAFLTMTVGGTLLTNDGSGNFSGLAGSNHYTFTNGTEVLVVSVPEPATWALLAFSLTTVMVLRRRRHS